MTVSKIYLNVPYAEKDAAKALGARWDATSKKWYVPADKEIELFAKWQTVNADLVDPASSNKASKLKTAPDTSASSVITQPGIKDFEAYNGDEPPWS